MINIKRLLSYFFIIGSNLIPLWGVLYAHWSLFLLLFLYWSETMLIGAFTLARMGRAQQPEEAYEKRSKRQIIKDFAFLFFGFMTVLGVSIVMVFGIILRDPMMLHPSLTYWHSYLLTLLIVFASLSFSYFGDYIGNQGYLRTSPYRAQGWSFGRVLVLFLAIVFGLVIGGDTHPAVTLVLFVVIKILFEVIVLVQQQFAPEA